jgi:hypothetical protein
LEGHPFSPEMINGESTQVEQRIAFVERVAESELFRKSPRLRDFLLYVADCTLHNRLADVREQIIAERVFGRKTEFNGSQDSIVRAEARNLRKRLETYFETEGRDEPIVIIMPKGGYALAFEPRSPEPLSESSRELTQLNLLTPEVLPQPIARPRAPSGLGYRNLSIVLGLVAAAASGLALHWRSADADLRKTLQIREPILPFSALFRGGKDCLIVTSDTGMLQISSLAHRRISLDEYMARTYPTVPKTEPPDLIKNWNLYEFTDGREMVIAGLIVRNYVQYAQRLALRSGHEVQLADFKDHSTILIGSAISNPWAQLYEDKLNFPTDLATDGRIIFRNKSPHAGEPSEYPDADDIQHHRTYTRVVFVPETSDAAPALLIAGTTAQSTEAGGEFLINTIRLENTLHSMQLDPAGPPHFFEVLIRSNNFVGGAILPEVVAWRTRKGTD